MCVPDNQNCGNLLSSKFRSANSDELLWKEKEEKSNSRGFWNIWLAFRESVRACCQSLLCQRERCSRRHMNWKTIVPIQFHSYILRTLSCYIIGLHRSKHYILESLPFFKDKLSFFDFITHKFRLHRRTLQDPWRCHDTAWVWGVCKLSHKYA